MYQKLRAQGVLVAVQFTVEEAMNGKYHESIGAASYTWAAAGDPDPTGEKLAAHAIFLEQNPDVQYHFIDFNCIPQNYVDDDGKAVKRTDEEQQYFDEILTGGGLNCLYFFVRVSSVVNESYLERFWPQFEAWLSMQFATPNGLKSAVGTKNERHHIMCIQNAAAQSEVFTKMLIDQWAAKTPREAFEFLSKPDVTVTNESDKVGQLPKIEKLDVSDSAQKKAFDAMIKAMASTYETTHAIDAFVRALEKVRNDARRGAFDNAGDEFPKAFRDALDAAVESYGEAARKIAFVFFVAAPCIANFRETSACAR